LAFVHDKGDWQIAAANMTHTANAGEKAWKAFQAGLLHIPRVKEKAVRAKP
jgi:hypothetical protein